MHHKMALKTPKLFLENFKVLKLYSLKTPQVYLECLMVTDIGNFTGA